MRAFLLALFLPSVALAQAWTQWGAGPRHHGALAVWGEPLHEKLAEIVYDPFVEEELKEAGGALLVHYQTPLSDGNEVFMELKGGTYTGFSTWSTQTWSIRKFAWRGGALVERWTAMSDWDPVPPGASRFEPVFHAVLANGALYMAGAGGTLLEIDRATGAQRRRHSPFGAAIDPTIYVTGPISADDQGNLYYNALKLPAQNAWSGDHHGAWLVKVTPQGVATKASYQNLVPGAPAPSALCLADFTSDQLPWPPSPAAVPRSVTCGSQRAGVNVAPAIAADGTVYTVSRAHLNSRWGWVVAVNPDLTPKWAASLRNRFEDGCNVLLPLNGMPGGCRDGARTGVDPSDNQLGSGAINDNATSSPIVAPDGTIFYGAYTRYNHAQGHLTRFSASGQYLGSYPFGWDVTPAIWQRDGTYSVVTKENRYAGVGTYCGNPQWCPGDVRVPGDYQGYFITQLSPQFDVEWKFRSSATADAPWGYEWCVNAPAVDARGVVYVNSEDGHLYAIDQGGTMRERIFLRLALGAAYTPLSLGSDGRVYTQNGGHLFVVGTRGKRRAVR